MHRDYFPHLKKQDQCFEDEQTEVIDSLHHKRILKDGKPLVKAWPHNKPVSQLAYENWLEKVVNPDTKEFYPALNKQGVPIKGTAPKHTITSIIRFKRKDGSEWLYSLGEVNGYDAFGNIVGCTLHKPEMWVRTLFSHTRVYDPRTNTSKMETSGILRTEDVYEIPFNERNLREMVDKRQSDSDISFVVKEESSTKAVEVKKDVNINKTLELFLKPWDFLL